MEPGYGSRNFSGGNTPGYQGLGALQRVSESNGIDLLENETAITFPAPFRDEYRSTPSTQNIRTRTASCLPDAQISLVSQEIIDTINTSAPELAAQVCEAIFPVVGIPFRSGDNAKDWFERAYLSSAEDRVNTSAVWAYLHGGTFDRSIMNVFAPEEGDQGMLARQYPWFLSVLCEEVQDISIEDWPWLHWDQVEGMGTQKIKEINTMARINGLATARLHFSEDINRQITFSSSKADLEDWCEKNKVAYPHFISRMNAYIRELHDGYPNRLPSSSFQAIAITETFSDLQGLCTERESIVQQIERWLARDPAPEREMFHARLEREINAFHSIESDGSYSSDTDSGGEGYRPPRKRPCTDYPSSDA
ncbi:hypothetical protein [Parendozoicomonas haliclonae]|uniref:Uncharacterized protein n=1 Tax=Parendozoicomonas haliclonae TaxID=1960125 RepID=A0A1X7ADV3_9GAMM|nr:hypothetical protein [Parendozoicomonas haliclonae]SMA32911.1 hypothetical protein EHSB41UT_00205 [Parendozoicomonas haliclonae]